MTRQRAARSAKIAVAAALLRASSALLDPRMISQDFDQSMSPRRISTQMTMALTSRPISALIFDDTG